MNHWEQAQWVVGPHRKYWVNSAPLHPYTEVWELFPSSYLHLPKVGRTRFPLSPCQGSSEWETLCCWSPITSAISRCLLGSQSIMAVNAEIQTSYLACKYSNVTHNSSLTFAKVTLKTTISFRHRLSPLTYLLHKRMTGFSVKHMKPGRKSS